MRLSLLCFFVFLLCTCVRAQEILPYTLFRPDVRYLYELQEWESTAQRFYGMELPASNDPVPTYQTIRASDGSDCFELVNSFAGAAVFQGDHTLLRLAGDTLRIEPRFPVGISWVANENLVGTIDREVAETVLEQADTVRYLVFTRPDGTLVCDEIRISKSYGLLSTPFFEDIEGCARLELVGISDPDLGLQAIDFEDVTNFAPGNQYHTLERRGEDNEEGQLIFTVTERKAEVKEVIRNADGSVIVVRRNDLIAYDPFLFGPEADTTFRSAVIDTIVFRPEIMPFVGRQIGEAVFVQGSDSTEAYIVDFRPDACVPALRIEEFGPAIGGSGCAFSWYSIEYLNQKYYFAGFGGPHGFRSEETGPAGSEVVFTETEECSTGMPLDFSGITVGATAINNDRVALFPNPASDRVVVSVPMDLGSVHLVVYDAAGREMRKTSATGGDRWLEVEGLQAGVYTVVFRGEEGIVALRRLIKQ